MRKTLALGLLLGCMGNFRNLPEHEQDRFQRCRGAIERSRCSGYGDSVATGTCVNGVASNYSDRPTERERQEFLIAEGCPADVANR